MEQGFPNSFLILKIDTAKGKKKIYHNLGFLSRKQADDFRKVLINAKPDSNETGL
ncbi:MAG: hypothetical protein QM564_02900 [Bergeyella sp.]